MQFFIVIGIILFMALFFMMSLPLRDELDRVEPDPKHKNETTFNC